MSEWSKEPDLRPGTYCAWVRTPLDAFFFSGDVAQMVERSLSMREVLGSMPSFSKTFWSYSVVVITQDFES